MKLTIEIRTDGDAFQDPTWPAADPIEVSRVLSMAEDCIILHGRDSLDWEATLFDSNGNRCGFVRGEYGE